MLMWPVISLTSHDTKKCDTHVYTSFFPPLIRRKQWGNWPNMYAKRPWTRYFILFVYFVLFQTTRLGGNWRLPTHQSQHDGTRSGIKADHFQSWTFAEAFNTGASSFYRKLIWFIYWKPLDSRRKARFNLRFFRLKKDTPERFIIPLFISNGTRRSSIKINYFWSFTKRSV